MKIFLLCFFIGVSSFATAASPVFEKLAQFELEKNKFKKSKIGGLSGAFFLKDHLYALSDDRGKVNEPRYYVFSVKLSTKNQKLDLEITPTDVIYIKTNSKPKNNYLDGEGFLALNEKHFLVSSEGDNNSKPRKPPRLVEIDPEGKFLKDWVFPEEVIPESLGQQKNGIQNNSGFEAISLSADGRFVVTAVERSLLQEISSEENYVRFYQYSVENSTRPLDTYFYNLTGIGVMSGVSEILSWKDKKYFVLERGVKPEFTSKIKYMTGLSLIDLDKTETIAQRKHLKKSRLDIELGEENFEAMAWGPAWGKYSRTLWIMNDNNFSKNEKNIFLVYGVN
ncbi:MAG: esterase-like activity of phytase family protein [Bdellovibrionota bacterium]